MPARRERLPLVILVLLLLSLVPLGRVVAGAGSTGEAAARSESERARPWLDRLLSSPSDAQEAARTVLAAADTRFVPVFIDLLRASQLGVVQTLHQSVIIKTLTGLSGKHFGDDWPAWADWYRGAPVDPPPGYAGWKGRLLTRFDPSLREFLRDGTPARIRIAEIAWDGDPVDGINALTRPKTVPATIADGLDVSQPVFGVASDGYARAYPLAVLKRHELVNDRIGGLPIVMTYCGLSGAGVAYEARASNGAAYTFGSSGLLYRSSKLMYDRETHTLWNEFTGTAVIGPLAEARARLAVRPLVLTSWGAWLREHPETKVLDPQAGYDRPDARTRAERAVSRLAAAPFPLWRGGQALPPKSPVFAVRVGAVEKAFPLEALRARGVVNDTVGGLPLVLVAMPAERRGGIAPVPTEVRAFAREGEEFRPGPESDTLLDGEGGSWWITEAGLMGPAGVRAPRVPGVIAYWFAWLDFFPQTLIYQP